MTSGVVKNKTIQKQGFIKKIKCVTVKWKLYQHSFRRLFLRIKTYTIFNGCNNIDKKPLQNSFDVPLTNDNSRIIKNTTVLSTLLFNPTLTVVNYNIRPGKGVL